MVIEKGDLDQIPVFQLLLSGFEKNTTGILYLKKEEVLKILYFSQGKLVSALSNAAEDRLEKILVARQLMDTPTLNALPDEVNIPESHGKDLVERDYITLEELIDCSKEQVRKIVADVLRWEEGRFQFVDDVPPDSLLNLDINIPVLIFKHITEEMEMEPIRGDLGPLDVLLLKTSDQEKLELFHLNDKQRALLLKNDGFTLLGDILDAYPESHRDSLLRVVYFFLKTGLLTRKEEKSGDLELDRDPASRSVYVEEPAGGKPEGFVFGKDILKPEPVELPPDESPRPMQAPFISEPGPVEEKKSRQFNFMILFVVLILVIGGIIFLLLLPDDARTGTATGGATPATEKRVEPVAEKKIADPSEEEQEPEPIEVEMEKTAAAKAAGEGRDTTRRVSEPATEKTRAEKPVVERKSPPPPAARDGDSVMTRFKNGDFRGASELWRLMAKSQAATHTILLELDCQKESVFNAYNRIDEKEQFFILERERDGRTCWLVCWGRFLSQAEAESGLRRVPPYFFQQSHPPQVVPLSQYLR